MLDDRSDDRRSAAVAEAIPQARSHDPENERASELESLVEKLGEAEASYRTLVEQLPAIVYTAEFGSGGEWRYVSPGIESILGFSPQEWLADPEYWFRQLHPEDRDRVLAEESLSKESGETLFSEYRMLTRDGRPRWFRDEAAVVKDDVGCPLFLQGVMYDVTDRRRAEDEVRSLNADLEQRVVERTSQLEAANQKLQTGEQRTRSIIELANDAFIDMDASGTITGWNRQAEATFGWLRDEAVGQLVADTIIPSRYREAHGRGLANFLATGEGPVLNTRIELHALHRDGHEFPDELTVSVLRGEGTVGFNAFVHDISERKQAEEALRQREGMLQAVFDASPDIITIIGSDGESQPASRAIRDILGYEPDDHAGKGRSEIIHPEDREQAALALRSLTQGERSADVRYRARHADGRWVVLESRAQSIGDAEGKPRGVVEISRDITERVALEESLVQAKREAERANQAKSEFLSRMSHELRTPLNAILGFGQLLEMDLDGADAHENIQYILRGGRLLLDLVNELLDIARIESGRTVLSLEPVRVKDALEEVMTLVRPLATVRGVRLESRASDAADGTVLADPQRLRQILLNLFSNAIKYNRQGGVVTVGDVEIAGDRLRISISDEGDGIAEDDLERLFTPFERLGVERTDVEGTGLGLAVSKSLAEAMGGSIGVRSEPGKGSTFVLELALVGGSEDP